MPELSLPKTYRWLVILVVIFLLAAFTACGGGGSSATAPPASLTAINITPASPSLALGLTQQMTAMGTFSDGGTRDLTSSVVWSSASPGVSSINTSGLASSLGQGTSIISATSGTVTGTTTLTVTAPVLASISVSPANATVALGLNQQFTATGTLTDKSTQALSNVTWTSSATGIATISTTGLLTSKALGTATITAASGSIKGTTSATVTPAALVSITVNPPTASVAAGLQQQFTATGSLTDGTSQPMTSVTWATSDQTLADVSSTGLATSHHPGTCTITATSGSVMGSTQLIIGPPVLMGMAVSPASATIQYGAASPQKYIATGSYSDQSTADLSSQVAWTVANPFIAGVDASGAASPLRAGFTKLTATLDSFSSTASITVLATPRYLYNLSDAGQDISRLTINASSGQPRYAGYQSTRTYNNAGFGCITTDPSNHYVYVTTQVSEGSGYSGLIVAYTLDATTGTLSPFPRNPYAIAEAPGCIQFEPSGNFAYATPGIEEVSPNLVTMAKDSSGNLSVVSSLTLPSYPGGLAIDPLGKFLYVVAEAITAGSPAYAYGYTIDPSTGSLSPIEGTPIQLPTNTYGLLSFNPSGDYLYMADGNSAAITGFNVNRTTGALTAGATNVAPCVNPTTLQFSPDGSLAFTTCSMDNNHDANSSALVRFTVAANGQLNQIEQVPSGLATSVTVDPSGQFIYVIGTSINSVNSQNILATYKLNTDGTTALLSQMAGRNLQNGLLLLGGATPVTYATQKAYITTSGDSKIDSFTLNSDGSLTPLQSTPTLTSPSSLAMLPWHSDLLVAARAVGSTFQGYGVNDSTGALTAGPSFRDVISPAGLAIDPSGTVAFLADSSSGLVYQYVYGSSPGDWETLQSSPGTPATFVAQSGAGPLAIDPAGRSLYVANQTANSISQFQFAGAGPVPAFPISASPLAICADTLGNLLFVAGSDNKLHMLTVDTSGQLTDTFDVSLTGVPTSVAVEPSGHYVYVANATGLSAFTVNRHAGTLTALTLSPSASLANATGVYIEPSGQYLYTSVSSSSANNLYVFAIQADGTLSSISTATIQTSDRVTGMVFHSQIQ